MFQFPGLSSPRLCVRQGDARSSPGGFAHSETRGSKGVCPSPRTIAACRVLRRLPVPRHPPCARGILAPLSAGPHVPCNGFGIYPYRMNSAHIRYSGVAYRGTIQLVLAIRCYLSSLKKKLIGSVIAFAISQSIRESLEPLIVVPLFAMRLSRYAGWTPGTGYRGFVGDGPYRTGATPPSRNCSLF